MENYKIIKGNNDEEIWDQVEKDLDNITYPFIYWANIQLKEQSVFLNIETDLGGGFESGFQSTTLTAPVPVQFTTLSSRINESKDFRFALHDEDFIDKLGKFFGMEDVKIGYPEFDKKMVVKTNDAEKTKAVFADAETRKVFQSLGGFNLNIAYYDDQEDKHSALELSIDREITNVEELHKIYNAFVHVLDAFEYSDHRV
jgi:hypothetical protein